MIVKIIFTLVILALVFFVVWQLMPVDHNSNFPEEQSGDITMNTNPANKTQQLTKYFADLEMLSNNEAVIKYYFSSLQNSNLSEDELYRELTQKLNPALDEYIDLAEKITPSDSELSDFHQRYLKLLKDQKAQLDLLIKSFEKADGYGMRTAVSGLDRAAENLQQWAKELEQLKKN